MHFNAPHLDSWLPSCWQLLSPCADPHATTCPCAQAAGGRPSRAAWVHPGCCTRRLRGRQYGHTPAWQSRGELHCRVDRSTEVHVEVHFTLASIRATCCFGSPLPASCTLVDTDVLVLPTTGNPPNHTPLQHIPALLSNHLAWLPAGLVPDLSTGSTSLQPTPTPSSPACCWLATSPPSPQVRVYARYDPTDLFIS
jgi:hypothetical protein